VAAAAISQFVTSLAAAAAAAAAVLMLSARRTWACLRCDAAPWRAAALPPRLDDRPSIDRRRTPSTDRRTGTASRMANQPRDDDEGGGVGVVLRARPH